MIFTLVSSHPSIKPYLQQRPLLALVTVLSSTASPACPEDFFSAAVSSINLYLSNSGVSKLVSSS
jgi:hypothetical protein